jgi:hypothetical protein
MNINYSNPEFKTAVRQMRNGSVLLEAVAALVLLTIASLTLLKGSLNTLAPRQWSLIQNITDAHLTYEDAYANRIPFEDLTGTGSPWAVYPSKTTTPVVLGTLPGGSEVTGTIIRTRRADANNFPAHGGSGTSATNPAEMQIWKVETHLLYEIGGRDYRKSRVCLRSQ